MLRRRIREWNTIIEDAKKKDKKTRISSIYSGFSASVRDLKSAPSSCPSLAGTHARVHITVFLFQLPYKRFNCLLFPEGVEFLRPSNKYEN